MDLFPENELSPRTFPDGIRRPALDTGSVGSLASRYGLPGYEIEARALERGIIPLRYANNFKTFSESEQIALLRSKVLIVGLGGLGGYILELLARMGVGRMIIADGDEFEETNLNRQLNATLGVIGASKAGAALKRLGEVNPSVHVSACQSYLDMKDMLGLMRGCDLAVDALGGSRIKTEMSGAAMHAGLPLVSGAVAGWTGIVRTIMPDARREPLDASKASKSESDHAGLSAEEVLGCPAPAVCAVAALMCREVFSLLTGKRASLAGRMLALDLNDFSFENFRV